MARHHPPHRQRKAPLMSDHLHEAREFVGCAENFSSPHDRSTPFALHGILHALIAIAERMPEPTRAEADR